MFSPFIFDLITINSRRLNDNDIYTDYKQISNARARPVYEINIAYIGSASTISHFRNGETTSSMCNRVLTRSIDSNVVG